MVHLLLKESLDPPLLFPHWFVISFELFNHLSVSQKFILHLGLTSLHPLNGIDQEKNDELTELSFL